MHIPDGFLDAKTCATTAVLTASGLGYALMHARMSVPQKRVPLLGLGAAFVFAAQMLNFPVAGGTSGHLIGGTLIAVLLGPSAALIVISAVLIVQCFMFADGGVTALGANIFNMGIVGGVGGWTIYYLLSRPMKQKSGKIFAAAVAAWISTVAASIVCAFELAASGTVAFNVALPAMAGVHVFIGIGEAIITALVLSAVWASRPDLLASAEQSPKVSYGSLLAYGGLIALWLAIFISPFASSSPDGLDKTAENLSFIDHARTIISAPMADYKMSFVSRESISTSIAGAVGTLVVFVLAWMVARLLIAKSPVTSGASLDSVQQKP